MTRVYIGHLSYRVRERDLEKFFRGFGKIREVLLKNGFGFVEFDDYRDADDAVYELNGRELDGERVVVELAHGTARRAPAARSSWMDKYDDKHCKNSKSPVNRYGPPTRTDYRVIIENLSSRVSWQVRWMRPSETFLVSSLPSICFVDLGMFYSRGAQLLLALSLHLAGNRGPESSKEGLNAQC